HTFRVLDSIGGMRQIAEWAAFHHERLDGNGYPFHLGERELTLGSRIMAVADISTALPEDRPYRKGLLKQEALEVLDGFVKNGAIDRNIVAALRENFDEINLIREIEQMDHIANRPELTKQLLGSTRRLAVGTA
ncbi:MAG: HD-GYP domain-containing protein, partial [Thermoguttaceae bacterium]